MEKRRIPGLRVLFAALAACACLPAAAHASIVYLSTDNGATLGGLTIRDGDVARYDTVSGVATLFFNEDLFSANENVDAFHLMSNGNILLSTVGAATLGGLSFGDGDVVQYNPGTNVATLFFAESNFATSADVDAFTLLSNGHYVLSTTTSEVLAGLTFRNGDLVEYNPVSGTATLFLNEDLFTADEDIDAVYVLPDGSVVLSTTNGATLGGLTFTRRRPGPLRGEQRHRHPVHAGVGLRRQREHRRRLRARARDGRPAGARTRVPGAPPRPRLDRRPIGPTETPALGI